MSGRNTQGGLRGTFESVAPVYDRLGVEYFGPVGVRLVELMSVGPGERIMDVGCGRGASLFPAAVAVGPQGRVVGIDFAPAMVAATKADARRGRLQQVTVILMDGQKPEFPVSSFDGIMGSMSAHMLPDLPNAVINFRRLLRPGGRLGVSAPGPVTGPENRVFGLRSIAEIAEAYGRTSGIYPDSEAFGGLSRFRQILRAAGFRDIFLWEENVLLTTESGRQFVEWTWSHGMRDLWERVPEQHRNRIVARIEREVESYRRSESRIIIPTPVRYVVATLPSCGPSPVETQRPNGTVSPVVLVEDKVKISLADAS